MIENDYRVPKLLLVPVRVLQSQVESCLPINQLLRLDTLRNIVNPEDLVFYQYVNKHRKDFIPKEVHDYFKEAEEVFNDDATEYKLGELGIKEIAPTKEEQIKLLALKNGELPPMGQEVTSNNYVGHYFEIDRETVGVMLSPSTQPDKDNDMAIRGLIALLANVYMGDVNGIADTSDDIHIRRLAASPLLRLICY